ncbi:MAG: hypothetical protein CL908_11985 [Deltaproteobacteria bacterium]|nr:hypothetical protein [Deltaproteobacteria bacterium]
MTRVRRISILPTLLLCLSCAGLNYPTPTDDPSARSNPTGETEIRKEERGSESFGIPEQIDTTSEVERPLSWSELTRLAREAQVRTDDDEASERLAQAALLVADLPPYHARRRATFGLRARQAMSLAVIGKMEAADQLADELIAEFEADPEIGGSAFVPLAISVAQRRKAAADEAGEPDAQLHLLHVALVAAQTDTASRERMDMAFRLSNDAMHEKEYDLARRAIDQAVLDAQRVDPLNREQAASLRVYKARVALAQGDLETAEAAATAANQIFEEISADDSNRGVAEATLAQILAERGELERALMISRGAMARLESSESLVEDARRQILGSAARVERISGNLEAARRHYAAALEIPTLDFVVDDDLTRDLARELAELGSAASQDEAARP